jgi:hypothetical protein
MRWGINDGARRLCLKSTRVGKDGPALQEIFSREFQR